jgi:hypothetical protein
MSERVHLEVPATVASLSPIRMVVGGVGARFDLSLDDLEDLYLAVGELLRVAAELGAAATYGMMIDVASDRLIVTVGPFRSPALLARLRVEPTTELCLDLCQLLDGVLDSFTVRQGEADFSVEMIKRRQTKET